MNHHAQRLLVAASRGARIQCVIGSWHLKPAKTDNIYGLRSCEYYTIHPDDIACQYGPIATELRRMASDYDYFSAPPNGPAALHWMLWISPQSLDLDNEDVFSWLCLFAAELAADEGM